MTRDDTQAALTATTATLATRELRSWEGEYSPEPDEYAAAHARTVAQLRDPAGPLAPLLAVLATVVRERDEARALAALVTTYRAAEAALTKHAPSQLQSGGHWCVTCRLLVSERDRALAALRGEVVK